jgi:uncharacterized membrane protein
LSTDPGTGGRRDVRAGDTDLPGVDRLLTLTDGVVAIALTLLVLQLRVPSASAVSNPQSPSALAAQLAKEADQFVSYGIAFYVVAQFWLVHHRVFRHIAGHRESLAWWNFAFLFTISIMPFTSDLLGAYGGNPLAVDIFALNLLLASLATQATLILGRRKALLSPKADEGAMATVRTRAIAMSAVIAASIGLAWVSTDAAKYSWLLMAPIPRVLARWSSRHEGLR